MRALGPVLLALCLLAPAPASAQIVDVSGRLPGGPEKGIHGDLWLSTEWRTGNVDYFEASGSLGGTWRHRAHSVFLVAEGEHQFSGGHLALEDTHEALRYRYQVNDFVAPELFVEHAYAPFRRLSLRVLYGGDLRFAMRVGDHVGVSFGFGLMGEHEVWLHDRLPGAGRVRDDLRYTTDLSFRIHLARHVHVSEVLVLEDRQDDPADARLRSDSLLTGKVNDWLELGLTFTVAYDGKPPPTVLPLDTTLRSFLSVDL